MNLQSTKHELVLGWKHHGELTNQLAAGHAFLREGDSYYSLKLMIFPGQTYYLTKNKDSYDRYTIFAKQVHTANGMKFQNPVGSGRLTDDLSSHMELYFPVIHSRMFMCL